MVVYEDASSSAMMLGSMKRRDTVPLSDPLALSIVIPAFNEGPRLIDRAARLIDAITAGVIDPRATELILVDDGSTDDTSQRALDYLGPSFPLMRVLRLEENSGKGAAIRVGASAAGAPIVAFMDADMSVDPSQIPMLLAAMADSDVVIGSRSLADSVVHSAAIHRKVMGRSFSFFVNGVTNVGLKDTQCGFKAFRTPVARILFHLMMVERFAFDVDVLSLARRLGMRISEVPVDWRAMGNSTVRPVADSIAMARDVFRLHRHKERPSIPALVIEPAAGPKGQRHRSKLTDSYPALRQTDPILPLPHDRALILLPLCGLNEIAGTAHRLSLPSTNLRVQNRLVSCAELTEMMPATWIAGGAADPGVLQEIRPEFRERRDDRTARHPRQFRQDELELAFGLEA